MILRVILIVWHQDCIVVESQSQLVFIKIILPQATKEGFQRSHRSRTKGQQTQWQQWETLFGSAKMPAVGSTSLSEAARLPGFFFFLSLFFNDRKVHLLLCNVLNMQRTSSGGRKGPGSTAYGSHQSMPRSSEIPNPDQVALGACNTLDQEAAGLSAPPFYRALDLLITVKSSRLLLSFSREVA